MQYNFSFCISKSSIPCVFLEVMGKIFNYFWKPMSPFYISCINCLLRFHFVYCNNGALKTVIGVG